MALRGRKVRTIPWSMILPDCLLIFWYSVTPNFYFPFLTTTFCLFEFWLKSLWISLARAPSRGSLTVLVRKSWGNNRPKLASAVLESSYLPYCGHRNKRPPESIPWSFDKWARKLFTIPVRVLSNLKKGERGWAFNKAEAIDVSLDWHQWRFWQFELKFTWMPSDCF